MAPVYDSKAIVKFIYADPSSNVINLIHLFQVELDKLVGIGHILAASHNMLKVQSNPERKGLNKDTLSRVTI